MPLALGLPVVVGHIKKEIATWWGGMIKQSHPGLLWSSTRLAPITGYTSTNQIFPDVSAVQVPWNDMVQSKLMGFLTTILADIFITVENLNAG